ncbi:MAG: DUF2752 domain-containing protein [Lachnospira sp.]
MKKKILIYISLFAGFVALSILLYITDIGCPIKYLTGISCPGCGLTRAGLSALQLDFAAAFSYHPLFFLVPVILIMVFLDSYIKEKPLYNIFLILCAVAFIVVYIVRLIDTTDSIVVVNVSDGLFYRMLRLVNISNH